MIVLKVSIHNKMYEKALNTVFLTISRAFPFRSCESEWQDLNLLLNMSKITVYIDFKNLVANFVANFFSLVFLIMKSALFITFGYYYLMSLIQLNISKRDWINSLLLNSRSSAVAATLLIGLCSRIFHAIFGPHN